LARFGVAADEVADKQHEYCVRFLKHDESNHSKNSPSSAFSDHPPATPLKSLPHQNSRVSGCQAAVEGPACPSLTQGGEDAKPVYTALAEAAARQRFEEFAEAWGARCPAMVPWCTQPVNATSGWLVVLTG
jgi:hypothetical protein